MSSKKQRTTRTHPDAEPTRGRVLVVDDDAHSVDILTRLLTRENFEVIPAYSGPECLRLVQTEQVDVILLDVMMPEMDGLQVCVELSRTEGCQKIPVILLTARDDMETRAAGMKLGVSEFLTKPVNREELFGRIRAQLHTRQLERDLERTRQAFTEPRTPGR